MIKLESKKDFSYQVAGGRVGVLLIHGLCGTPSEMRYVANGLARAGYTVSCPQLAGHCGTEADIKAATWQDWYASAEAALDDMRKNCDTVIVGGLSTGAVLSLMLAAKRPQDVQGTALFAPTLWLNGWIIPWYARLFRLITSKALANRIRFTDREPHGIKDDRIRKFFCDALFGGDTTGVGLPSTPGGAVLEHRRLVNATLQLIKCIKQPALILHPREDDYADLNNAWHLQRTISGMVDMVVLDDSYHNITLDRQRHIVVERTSAFVARIANDLEKRKAAAVNFRPAIVSVLGGASQAQPAAA